VELATDTNGNFRVQNLSSGEYRAAAWTDLEQGLAEARAAIASAIAKLP
jgi:hypothetical protein